MLGQFPKTEALFDALPNGEAHLKHLIKLDTEFDESVKTGRRRFGPVEDRSLDVSTTLDFDIIYAGGTLALPHAVLMARRGYRVLVFDRYKVGFVRREWNVGREEFEALHRSGLFSPEVAETMAFRRYSHGIVRWHGGPELAIEGVLDVPLDAASLMKTTRDELTKAGGQVRDRWTLERYCARPRQVEVAIQTPDGPRQLTARLLVLATGASAARDFDLICPTVGTVATGFVNGTGKDEVNPDVGEVLVSTEGISRGRQLIWELFPGREDEVATYLFYYHEPRPEYPGQLLELFERYLEKLPSYKRSDHLKHLRPVYGFIPAYTRQLSREVSPCERILAYGDAAAQQSPLTFTGFGSALRHLSRMADGVDQALRDDDLSQKRLNQLRAGQANLNILGSLTLMMTVRQGQSPHPEAINKLLIAAFDSLWSTEGASILAFMQDRFSWAEFTRFMLGTMERHPRIFAHVFSVLTPREVVHFVKDYVHFALVSGTTRMG